MFEFAWQHTSRHRDGNEERDKFYPAFRRLDVSKHARWKFMPGALLLPIRGLLFLLPICFFVGVCFVIKKFGLHNFEKGPLRRGSLKSFADWSLTSGSWLAMLIAGVSVTKKVRDDVDYSKYLGPDYKKGYTKDIITSTYISNHMSALWDPFIIGSNWLLFSPVLEAGLKKNFIFGNLADALSSLYVNRGGSKQYLQKLIDGIIERQNFIE